MVEGTQIERECSREGEGVDQEKLCARGNFVGGGDERRRCGKEAARACGCCAQLAACGR